MRKLVCSLVAAAGLFAAPDALAQNFGQKGDLSISADRLFGLYLTNDVALSDGFLMALGIGPIVAFPYTTARLGVDYFVIDHLSVGGNLGIIFGDDNNSFGGDDDFTAFLIEPRVGYAVNISDKFGIWPRGGITFFDIDDFDGFALTLEAPFFFTPTDGFGLAFGPSFDIELAGDGDEGFVFGIVSTGVFGWL